MATKKQNKGGGIIYDVTVRYATSNPAATSQKVDAMLTILRTAKARNNPAR
jgi:hypothetical protein